VSWKFWNRGQKVSVDTEIAKQETEEAEKRLRAIEKDDVRLHALTARTQRLAIGNNFAADIRKALGGGAR